MISPAEQRANEKAERTAASERAAMGLGARCDLCWLRARRDGGPVLGELNEGAGVLVVGEAPGAEEVTHGRPFVGASGRELDIGLISAGWKRRDCSFDNVLACRPPDNKLERVLAGWKKENARRLKLGAKPGKYAEHVSQEPRELDDIDELDEDLRREAAKAEGLLPHPFDCCRPRLLTVVRRYQNIIAAGRTAMNGLLGLTRGILDSRGGPIEGYFEADVAGAFVELPRLPDADRNALAALPEGVEGVRQVRVLPTVHPSLVLHNRSWTRAFRSDLAKAWRWFNGRLGWRDPKVTVRPSVEELEAFLFAPQPFFSWDVETEWKKDDPRTHSPLLSRLRCIGISTRDEAVVVPFLSINGALRFYSPAEEERLKALFTRWFTDRAIVKVGWNSGYYDALVVYAWLGVEVQ